MSRKPSQKDGLATRLSRGVTAFTKYRAIKTRNTIPTISYLLLKNHYNLPREDDTNSRVHDAVDRFFSWRTVSAPPEDRSFLRWLDSDPDSRFNRKPYYEIQYWLRSDTEDGPAIAARYRQLYDEDIEKLTNGAISAYHGHFRKKFRQVLRQYRRRVVARIPLSLRDLAYTVPVFSLLVLLGGYFYTYRVFHHFGIRISDFFTVTDYLATSVHAVGYAAIAAAITSTLAAWDLVRESTQTDYGTQTPIEENRWLWRVILAVSLYFLWSADQEIRATVFFVPPLVMAGTATLFLVVNRRFRPSLGLLLTALSTIAFAALLYVDSNRQVFNIQRGAEDQSFRVEARGGEFTSKSHSIIGSSDKYMFLWQRDGKHVEVVPHAEIKRVSLSERSE